MSFFLNTDVIDQYVSSEFTDTDVEWESFPTNLHVKLERCVNSLKRIFDTSAERPVSLKKSLF